jgi:hypothetical protein
MAQHSIAGNIMQTTDYDSIKKILVNRIIKDEHVNTLRCVIRKQGWLAPGLVWIDEKGEKFVVDGQHSKEACKLEGIPFRYTVMKEKPDVNFIASLNSHRKAWQNPQYLDAQCKDGKQGYIQFSIICKEKGISIENLLIILGIDTSGHESGLHKFREGHLDKTFLKTDWNTVTLKIQQWKELSKVYGTTHKCLLRSMIRIQSLCPTYSHVTMVVQCKAQPNKCKQYTKTGELIPVLLEIYNHRLSKNKIEI